MKYILQKFTNVKNYVDFRHGNNWYYRDSTGNIYLLSLTSSPLMSGRIAHRTKTKIDNNDLVGISSFSARLYNL